MGQRQKPGRRSSRRRLKGATDSWSMVMGAPPAMADRGHFRTVAGPLSTSVTIVLGDSLWEENAAWWQRHYTDGVDPEYEEQVLPLVTHHLEGTRRTLDVGCGEGQVTRHLAQLGVQAGGGDPTPSQIRVAHQRGGSASYGLAQAQRLPFLDASFDSVVLCMALEHIDPFEPALEEVARVLAAGGRFLLFLVHPFLQTPGSGWVDDVAQGEQFWRVGEYLRDDVALDEVAPGIQFEFAHRPLGRYIHAMGAAGLLVDDMVEPAPPARVLRETGDFPNAATIPRLLLVCARHIT
jgi:SAM-dependent methyltransferase